MDTYINYTLKPDFRAAGPVLGATIKAFGAAIAKADPKAFLAELEKNGQTVLKLNDEDTVITPDMISSSVSAKEGFDVAHENGVSVILNTELSKELIDEGLARELISKVQQLRKSKNFEMMDRIVIYLEADDEVRSAAELFNDYICSETLANSVEFTQDLEKVDVNGHKTGIDVKKVD